jgi:nitroreductase
MGEKSSMTFEEAVRGRHSVRRYLPDPVPREDVEQMVSLATCAASASNGQMWRFIAVQDREVLQAMKRAIEEHLDELKARPELAGREKELEAVKPGGTFFAEAPLCVAVLCLPYASRTGSLIRQLGVAPEEEHRLWPRPDLQSIGAAVQLLITAAHSMGYGACWMTAPVIAAEGIERVLGVRAPARLVALVPIGRPAGTVAGTGRLPLDDVLSFR